MSYTVEWNPLLDSEDVKRTLAKLHLTFMSLGFMSITRVLKIVVTNKDMVEVYVKNGQIYCYQAHTKNKDLLDQVGTMRME